MACQRAEAEKVAEGGSTILEKENCEFTEGGGKKKQGKGTKHAISIK